MKIKNIVIYINGNAYDLLQLNNGEFYLSDCSTGEEGMLIDVNDIEGISINGKQLTIEN